MTFRPLIPALLFTLVALASFSVWAFGSRLYSSEGQMYALCALVFLGLGGFALTTNSGIGDLKTRLGFSARFALGFIAYSLIWSVSWFTFRDTFGEVIGSFFGLLILVYVLRRYLSHSIPIITATATVFLWHTLGYYTGGMAYKILQGHGSFGLSLALDPSHIVTLARLSWGLFYGLGLGFALSTLLQRSPQS